MKPDTPAGSGKHPIALVAITARQIAESSAFYSRVFGWQTTRLSEVVTAAVAPSGPLIALRSDVDEGFQASVPFISVPDVESALLNAVTAGGLVQRAPWNVPMVGRMARFTDASGTVYGLLQAAMPG